MTIENSHDVFIPVKGADNVMPMVRYLREKGLVQGIDFEFRYQGQQWDMEDRTFIRRGVTFSVRDEKWATFIRLKFSDEICAKSNDI